MNYPKVCWAAQFFDSPCAGRYDRMHVGFQKQELRRIWNTEESKRRHGEPYNEKILAQDRVLFSWAWEVVRDGCRHHHNLLDGKTALGPGRYFKLRRDQLPDSVERFAEKYDLTDRLDLDYGPRELQEAA